MLFANPVLAQAAPGNYPDHPVKIIAPYAPGGTVDALSREMAVALTRALGKTFFVENRAGAGGNIGLAALAKSTPDGYTIGVGAANMLATNRALYKSLPFDTLKDFTPVGFIGNVPYVLVVHPSVPAKTLPELIALMKANPNKYSFGSSGVGNTAHLFGELFKVRAGVQMVHVPYKSSGEALQDLLAGRIQVQFFTPVDLMPQIQRGALRPIAVASPQRLPALPDVPTLGEMGLAGFDSPTWFGVIAPAGTPPAIVNFLNAQIRKSIAEPDVAQRLATAGVVPRDMSPAEFDAFIREEVVHWAEIVKLSGASLD
jgi:tripartite-type tricarboxylate transporter receptor subunit TctC